MNTTSSGLHLTYTELLTQTEDFIRIIVSQQNEATEYIHERGMRRGFLLHWYLLAYDSGIDKNRLNRDWEKLLAIAELSTPAQAEED